MGQDATLEILAEILLDVGGNRETLIIRLPAPINRCARNALRLALATAFRSVDPIRE